MNKGVLKKSAAVFLSAAMAAGVLTGCGNSAQTSNGDKVLFSYDGQDVTLKEAWIYAKMTAAQYEAYYTSYFGEDFWSMDMGTDDDGNATTFEDYVKEQVVTQIKQVIVLNNKAEELGCSLTDEEKEECAEYASAFADEESGKEILTECGATEEDMAAIYEDNKLASKVQEEMVKDTDTEVSDDEARETKISRIVFSLTTTDDDGNSVDMTDEEKAATLATAQAALAEVLAGTAIADVAEEQEYTSVEETFAAGESEEGEAFEALLATMNDGDVIQEVQECDNGYVVAQLDAYTDADATEENRESIISEREQETFTTTYDEWTADLEEEWSYSEDVDQDLWAEVTFSDAASTATESQADTAAAESDTAAEADTAAADTAAEADTAAADTAAEADTAAAE